jgi:tRNA nucleotidyltransferase/poly(A) polymerase
MRLVQHLNEAKEAVKQWGQYVKRSKDLKAAVEVLKKINKLGHTAFIVGGAVRDIILGIEPKDMDIATNAPIEKLEKIWKVHDIGKSKEFGIVVVKQSGVKMEVAQYRADGKYVDGRRPESVAIKGTFEDDAGRRDFTVNAMGIDKDGNIIDYFDGKKDIKNKVLRTVGDPKKRFGEDYLRMLRAGRFSSKLDFDIEKDTKKAIQKLSQNIKNLSPERIKDELMKAASQGGKKFAVYIKILDELKLLRFILPEVMNLKWFKENLIHHPETRGAETASGTVWAHTMAALKASNTADPIKQLAILLHDVGKGVSLSHEKGLPRYLGHAKMSVKLVTDITDRLRMSNKEKQALLFAVGNHMKFHNILAMKASKIAKLVADENWDVLVAVARADEFSRGSAFKHAGEFEKIVDKAIKIKEKFGIKETERRLKLVSGDRVMELLGLKPGKKVGEIIKKTTEWALDSGITDKDEIDEYIRGIK